MTITPGEPRSGRPAEPVGPNTVRGSGERSYDRDRGAVAVDDRPRRKGPLWLLLGLLALVLLAVLLYNLLHKDNDKKDNAAPATPVASSITSAAPSPAASAAPATGNVLVSGGVSLLPLSPTSLAAHNGQPVTGTAVIVQAPLAPKDGLFVGDTAPDAIFLDLADPLPNTPTSALTPFQVGQKVSFTAKLVANTSAYLAEAGPGPEPPDHDSIPNFDQIKALGYHLEAFPTDVKSAG